MDLFGRKKISELEDKIDRYKNYVTMCEKNVDLLDKILRQFCDYIVVGTFYSSKPTPLEGFTLIGVWNDKELWFKKKGEVK